MQRLTCIALLLCSTFLQAQPVVAPEAASFVPEGYEVLDYKTGDLNGDKKADAILILKIAGEDSSFEENDRPLLLLIRQADGKLKQIAKNDNAVLCRQCGGVFGDPYEGLTIANNGFSISFYGGSSWRWGYTFDFVYRPLKKNWFLVKESQVSFQAGDPEATMKNSEIGESELGEISIQKFNSEPAYADTKWKVIAAKTFFYDSPKIGSKPRKAYLLKGNTVTGIRHLKNFIEVSFENKSGEISTGFILRNDLQAIK
jgi:hypothetical protein